MKKVISILLASMMLAGAAPAVISGENAASLDPDFMAPAKITDSEVVIAESVSAAEVLSYFADNSGLTVKDADGKELSPDDKVSTGATVSAGAKSLTVAVYGDANGDGKINARDVVATMRNVLDGTAVTASDINDDGAVNAKDVTKLMRGLVGYNEPFGENHAYNEAGSDKITLYFDSLMHRVGSSNTTVYGNTTGLIRMAKNELEDAQLMIITAEEFKDVTVKISEMKNANGDVIEATVYDMYDIPQVLYKQLLLEKGSVYAEPNQDKDGYAEFLPKLVGTIDLDKDESHGVMIQVKTTKDSAPGYYSATVTVEDKDGNELKCTVLRTLVWDVALDDETACDTAFGFGWLKTVMKKYDNDLNKVNSPEVLAEIPEIYDQYAQFLMDNRISTYHLPFDVTDSRADKYMSDPRVTSFCVDGGGKFFGVSQRTDAQIISIYNKLQQKPEWLEKAYVYLSDEPGGTYVRDAKTVYDRMTGLFEKTYGEVIEWHQVVPMYGNFPYTDDDGILVDACEYTNRYSDIMCPQSYAFTPYYTRAERLDAQKKGITLFPQGSYVNSWVSDEVWAIYPKQFQERYDEWADNGLRRWWYVCNSPMIPHANYFKYYQGAPQRVLLWQQYLFNVDGLLYWDTQADWDSINLKRPSVNGGDGLIIYWGELFGQHGPVSCIRLEYIRDSIEDFQYMKQLERCAGSSREDVVETYVKKVTTEILRYTEDPYVIEDVRTDMGFALERLSK